MRVLLTETTSKPVRKHPRSAARLGNKQRPYRDFQVLTETGQRPKTETTSKPVRKTETVECVKGVSQVKPSLTHSTVSVFRTGFEVVSVFGLCPVSVKTWESLYGLCSLQVRPEGGVLLGLRKLYGILGGSRRFGSVGSLGGFAEVRGGSGGHMTVRRV